MDRQAVFKKISRVLIPIEITFVIASTVFAGAIFYFAFNEFVKTHEVNMKQFFINLTIYLISVAAVSIIVAAIQICFQSESGKKAKRMVILSIVFFLGINLSFLYLGTLYQYKYFPLIFFGSAIITVLCKFLALVPNGLRYKSKQFLLKLKQFIFLRCLKGDSTVENNSHNDINSDEKINTEADGIQEQSDFISSLIDNEKIHLKKVEILFLDLQELIQRKEAISNELIERIEIRDNSEHFNKIKSIQDKFDNEYSSKISEIKRQLKNLDSYFKLSARSYKLKIEEIELLTKNKKLSPILTQRIKEYKKEIRYLNVKIEICNNFLKCVNEEQKNDLLQEFQQFEISLIKKEIDKRFFKDNMILSATIIVSLSVLIALLYIIIGNVVEALNAFKEPPTKSINTILKVLRNILTTLGVLLVGVSLFGLNVSDTPEATIRSKTLLGYGIVLLFITCITSFILAIF